MDANHGPSGLLRYFPLLHSRLALRHCAHAVLLGRSWLKWWSVVRLLSREGNPLCIDGSKLQPLGFVMSEIVRT